MTFDELMDYLYEDIDWRNELPQSHIESHKRVYDYDEWRRKHDSQEGPIQGRDLLAS